MRTHKTSSQSAMFNLTFDLGPVFIVATQRLENVARNTRPEVLTQNILVIGVLLQTASPSSLVNDSRFRAGGRKRGARPQSR